VEVADANRIDTRPASKRVSRPGPERGRGEDDRDPYARPGTQEDEQGRVKTPDQESKNGSGTDSHVRSIGAAQPPAGGKAAEGRRCTIRPPPTTASPR